MHAELDPTGANPHEPGAKLDSGKSPVFRGAVGYFPRALREIAMVSLKGAEKYTWKGWRDVPEAEDRYLDALMRHLLYVAEGCFLDDGPGGTGMPHIAQVAWNALAVLELTMERIEPTPTMSMGWATCEELEKLYGEKKSESAAEIFQKQFNLPDAPTGQCAAEQFASGQMTGEQLDMFRPAEGEKY